MGNETFKKTAEGIGSEREASKKAARLMERRNEKLRTGNEAPEENPKANGSVSGPTPNSNMLIRHGTESIKQRPRALSIRLRIDEALAVT